MTVGKTEPNLQQLRSLFAASPGLEHLAIHSVSFANSELGPDAEPVCLSRLRCLTIRVRTLRCLARITQTLRYPNCSQIFMGVHDAEEDPDPTPPPLKATTTLYPSMTQMLSEKSRVSVIWGPDALETDILLKRHVFDDIEDDVGTSMAIPTALVLHTIVPELRGGKEKNFGTSVPNSRSTKAPKKTLPLTKSTFECSPPPVNGQHAVHQRIEYGNVLNDVHGNPSFRRR